MMEFEHMSRMNEIRRIVAVAGLLGGLVMAGGSAFAQTSAPPVPAKQGDSMMNGGMSKGQGGMPGMMMNPEIQQKMSRMMDNCNHMMESTMQNNDSAPTTKG